MTDWIIQIVGWIIGLGIITVILQHHFDKKISKFNLINESQFKAFNELWKSLMNLKREAEILWNELDKRKLSKFVESIKEAHISFQNNSLVLNKEDYDDLKEILDQFWNYKIGKERLIEMSDEEIQEAYHLSGAMAISNPRQSQVWSNESIKRKYEGLLENLREKFQAKMGIK